MQRHRTRGESPKGQSSDSKPGEGSTRRQRSTSRDREGRKAERSSKKGGHSSKSPSPSRKSPSGNQAQAPGASKADALALALITTVDDVPKSTPIHEAITENRRLVTLEGERLAARKAELSKAVKKPPNSPTGKSYLEIKADLVRTEAKHDQATAIARAYAAFPKISQAYRDNQRAAYEAGKRDRETHRRLERQFETDKEKALQKVHQRLESAARTQPLLVLRYCSLLEMDGRPHCPSVYLLARSTIQDGFCGHDIRYLERAVKELERFDIHTPYRYLLYLSYLVYVYQRWNEEAKQHGNHCRGSANEEADSGQRAAAQWVAMLEDVIAQASKEDAMAAIKKLEAEKVLGAARILCGVCLQMHKEEEFEKKLVGLFKPGDLNREKALCEARPLHEPYWDRIKDAVIHHPRNGEAAEICEAVLTKHPGCHGAVVALSYSLLQMKNLRTAVRRWSELIRMHPRFGFHPQLNEVLLKLNDNDVGLKAWVNLSKELTSDEVVKEYIGRYKTVKKLKEDWKIACPACMRARLETKCTNSGCKHMYCMRCAGDLVGNDEKCYGCDEMFHASSRLEGGHDKWMDKKEVWMKACMNTYVVQRKLIKAKEVAQRLASAEARKKEREGRSEGRESNGEGSKGRDSKGKEINEEGSKGKEKRIDRLESSESETSGREREGKKGKGNGKRVQFA
jgi:hypothetical protein